MGREKRMRLPVGLLNSEFRKKREIVNTGYGTINNIDSDHSDTDDNFTDPLDVQTISKELNDEELEILARIVQDQLDRYVPDVPVDEYRIVKLPQGSGKKPISSSYVNNINDNSHKLAILGDSDQPKLVLPVIELPSNDIYEMNTNEQIEEVPEYVFLPAKKVITVPTNSAENELIPIDEDTLNEYELRNRIAGLANALNERATRAL
ncbi:unnamed protein product [Thelazia callipaeda]|uniref:Reverse transcriptase domain-containing protein n=1 Tax=Thelazia callipaeda TaxID=103827 RepID=A0A0N5CXU5_THECL|nr:unnamed protein product [Thelazia callipaeda]